MTTVILCGGAGTRLWPLSRRALPKQFCDLLGGATLFERTLGRNLGHSERFLVVANRAHYGRAMEQFRRVGAVGKEVEFILEPLGRNTAPAIALACCGLDPEETVLVTPSDHVIKDEGAYGEAVLRAREAAAEGFLVTFGLTPEYPETGYGYIEAGAEAGPGYRRVGAFREKPDRATAEGYVAAGRFFWNSGMFCFKAGVFLGELRRHAPAIFEAARRAYLATPEERGEAGECLRRIDEAAMRAIPADSVDYAVMEKTERAAVVPCSIGWSDLGSWDSIYEVREKDGSGTSAGEELLSVESRGNLVLGSGRRVVLVGVEDLIVVDTGDALLVTRRGQSQDVKKAVEALRERGESELL